MDFRIASYNIRKCIGLDRKRDPGRTVDVLNSLKADIVVLQEADKRLGQRPAALCRQKLKDHSDLTPWPLAEGRESLGSHGNALLLRNGFTANRIVYTDLPGLEPRGALIADLTTPAGALRVVGVHLGLIRRHRRLQLEELRNHLLALPEMPTLIAGDFNEWSATKGLEALSDMNVITPGRSFHAARPLASLDRIAHCDAHGLLAAGVCETPLARRASDHLPVWADFTRIRQSETRRGQNSEAA